MTSRPHPKIPKKSGTGSFEHVTFDSVLSSPSRKWGFGTQSRFPKVQIGNENISYDMPSTLSTRATNAGIGERFKSRR